MQVQSFTGYAAVAVLVGALACAGNPPPESDEAAAARDTVSDTLGGEVQNPPGYRGMERDTTQVPAGQPSDTFLEKQGTGQPQDTSGYSGMERVDTTGQAAQTETTGFDTTGAVRDTTGAVRDTSGAAGTDTTSWAPNQSGMDTTGTPRTGDTTGYNPSQQSGDSAAQ
jgi:hypothetical protein